MLSPLPFGRRIIGTLGIMGGIPSLPTPFVKSLTQIHQYNYEHWIGSNARIREIWSECSLHSAARNDLCNRALGDWLVMLDTDHVNDADCVCRLAGTMRLYEADVVSGIYYRKDAPHFPLLYAWDEEKKYFVEAMTHPNLRHPFLVDGAGGGILCVSTALIERIKTELGKDPFDIEQAVAEGQPPFGEDLSFFLKCMMLDPPAKVVCHPGIISYHLQTVPVTPMDHERAMEEREVQLETEGDAAMGKAVVLYGATEVPRKLLTGMKHVEQPSDSRSEAAG